LNLLQQYGFADGGVGQVYTLECKGQRIHETHIHKSKRKDPKFYFAVSEMPPVYPFVRKVSYVSKKIM